MIDIDVKSTDRGDFDISIDPATGDLLATEGFDTSLKMSLFEERRADRQEMIPSERRRGWWANELFDEAAFEIGSKLWLIDQARLNQETLNRAIDYARQALQWLINDNHVEAVEVSGRLEPETIILEIVLLRNGSKVDSFSFDIWSNTGTSLD